ncbi:hypothetical protein [Desulfomicrobium salsuginis]
MSSETKSLAARSMLFLVGTAFVLYGVVMPILPFAGARTEAEITTVRRELGDRQDPMANRYSWAVGYEFVLPGGTVVHGNTKVIGSSYSAGIAKGPAVAHYLPSLPWVNALERDTRPDLGKAVMVAAGALLCFVAFKGPGLTSRRRSRSPRGSAP